MQNFRLRHCGISALLLFMLCISTLLPNNAAARTINDLEQKPLPAANQSNVVSAKVPSDSVLEKYYITKGERYKKIVALLESLPVSDTGLDHSEKPCSIKIDKEKTGGYFYHAQSYDSESREVLGDFLIAKDDSCAWRTDTGGEAKLIYGNTEKLLKKCDIRLTASHIIMGDYARVRVKLPAALPYDIRVTSLNESIATIDEEQRIIPISCGKVELVIELRIGESIRTFERTAYIVDEHYYQEDRGGWNIPIGIGIDIGPHHHRHGHGHIGVFIP